MAEFSYTRNPEYTPELDGTLENYISNCRQGKVPVFRGIEIFEELREKGFLTPWYHGIRISNCMGGFDESYLVTDEFKLKGLSGMFAGKKGIYEPKDILNVPTVWELLT